jgi:serine/threonine-protein kinase PpkA
LKHDAIPGYRIERLIGKGGMASVYLAIQESLGRPVALKVLSDPESPEFSKRFINEGRIIAGLSHTNIITVHDVGIAHGQHYLSMEYVEGGDLRSRIAQGMTADVALDIVGKIASCLDFAHKRGLSTVM